MSSEPEELMRSIIERIATGPEMSKNISETEAYEGMTAVLDRRVSDVRAALFLIALRMKRETGDENRGAFRALVDSTVRMDVEVDELLTLADPFNGFNRGLPMSPFLPPLLAACGLPCLSTGIETVAPKFGLTHFHVLTAAGKSVALAPPEAARQLCDAEAGWAYLDQSATHPKLHRLRALRREIVKRPLLSTCEVALQPLAARRRNLVYLGYVHANYPPVYAMLADLAGFDAAIIVKGVEGGVVPSLQAGAKLFMAAAGRVGEPVSVKPEFAGVLDAQSRALPLASRGFRDTASHAAEAVDHGLSALAGESGLARQSLVYAAAIALFGAGRCNSIKQGAEAAGRALDSGEARARFEKAA